MTAQHGAFRAGLTVVIPARNEVTRIAEPLENLASHLKQLPDSLPTQILVVDNASTDGTRAAAAAHDSAELPVRTMAHPIPGKGGTVRAGILASDTQWVGFVDADGATDPSAIPDVVAALESGADVVLGARSHGGSFVVGQNSLRRWGGFAFRAWVAHHLGERYDTQCGFKFFTAAAARSLFAPLSTEGWAFDVEVLARARSQSLQVRQVPVRWTHQPGSGFHTMRDGWRSFRDVPAATRAATTPATRAPSLAAGWEPAGP